MWNNFIIPDEVSPQNPKNQNPKPKPYLLDCSIDWATYVVLGCNHNLDMYVDIS